MTDEKGMNTRTIKQGEVYMAVINGNEMRIRIDFVAFEQAVGTDIESYRGVIIPASTIVAGPLKIDSRLSKPY